jgi:leucyl/phenylalanyl-tRNA---protein transferase
MQELHPDIVLKAYRLGLFPMAEHRYDPRVLWVDPDYRGVLPLDTFHVPRSLYKRLKHHPYQIKRDTDVRSVIKACASSTPKRPDTWINNTIADVYTELAELGHAHSVEVWDGKDLVGGLYGVAMGAAFFGESMFSRRPDTSKMALVALVEHLKERGFQLLDTQFVNDHLRRFGAIEIPRAEFQTALEKALERHAVF